MKKQTASIIVLLCITAHMVLGVEVPLQFPRAHDEPADVYPDKLIEAVMNYTPERWAYAKDCWSRKDTFFAKYKTDVTERGEKTYIAEWKLVDDKEQFVDKNHFWCAGDSFHIINFHGKLYYRRGSSFAYLHYDTDKCYIGLSVYGIVKEIKIIDGRLYFYVLNGDEWVLDPIHEGGKYFYKKYPPVDIIIP